MKPSKGRAGRIGVARSRGLARAGGAALVAVAAIAIAAAPSSAKTTTKTYSSGAINAAIPDGAFPAAGAGGVGTAIDTTRVRGKGKLTDVNVSVRITHPFDRDLEIWLMSPNHTVVKAVVRRGGNGDNFGAGPADCTGTFTVLDDQAETPVAGGAAPLAGSFVPDQPLSALAGQQAKGAWSLFVLDTAVDDAGTLHCWELTATTKSKKRGKRK